MGPFPKMVMVDISRVVNSMSIIFYFCKFGARILIFNKFAIFLVFKFSGPISR